MSLSSQVNKSGFPLQLALANLIKRGTTNWRVLYEEHSWTHDLGEGFIDLVIEDTYKTWLMNVECKRVRDSSWIFLRDAHALESRRHAKLWVTRKNSENELAYFGWVDVPMDPICPESSICIVPGQDARTQPMLERTASIVVRSTEALAKEEASLLSSSYSDLRIYQNVVVTTAALKVAVIDANKIDIATGVIDDTSQFIDVPFVRFRKQLRGALPGFADADYELGVREIKLEKESTVFVVNSEHFLEFVSSCELPDDLGKYVRAR